MRRRLTWLAAPALAAALAGCAFYAVLSRTKGVPAAGHKYFANDSGRTLVIAHRGGAGLWPENTLYAFERAAAMGVDVIETDVRATKDGELVLFHDDNVNRTTGGAGPVGALTLAELKRLDAAYRFSADGGRSFPLRGQGVTVPTLREVFEALPRMRFNIEPKRGAPSLAAPLCRLIRERGMTDRVLVASFTGGTLADFRRECPEIASSASTGEVASFLSLQEAGLADSYSPAMQALQVPERAGVLRLLTRDFVEAAHGRNLRVHAWTINDEGDMRRLVEMGVDGVMTDYPDRLLRVLGREAGQYPAR
ncbi:MAG TPA: glycerophosphodiester phosphodiesterase [Pyrinomonadaceae bacterium]|nr:glycerophosphodiester phosphodiesterase [Pyrinomonadaceae bacterium]